MKSTLSILATTLFLTVLAAAPAAAFPEQYARCDVKKTSDGFVALRSGPSASTKMLRKVKRPSEGSADAGTFDFSTNYTVFPERKKNGWVFVKVILYNQNDCDGDQECVTWQGKGYIRANLIDWSTCGHAG